MTEADGAQESTASIGDRVRHLIDDRWDSDRRMQRLLPGAAPQLGHATDSVHMTRETALGALSDLASGHIERAVEAIESVLECQYPLNGLAWGGTFKVAAAERTPPDDAVEWYHYDPNWRQFLGVILAIVVEEHANQLPEPLVARIVVAIEQAVDGEPADRIARWYTNPNLMHAWLQGWVGRRVERPELIEAGERRARDILQRFDTYGDVDEYNSPTYDGIDLMAAGLWVTYPPTDRFAARGRRLIEGMGHRISTLFHPELAAMAGPYIRSYGYGLDRHVSLLGLWLAMAGADSSVPAEIDAFTDHIHDLLFWPLLQIVAPAVLPALELRPVLDVRRHEQRFRNTLAASVLAPNLALGVESGRRSPFSRDQYAPVVAHWLGANGAVEWLAIMLEDGTAVDAALIEETVDSQSARFSIEILLVRDGTDASGHAIRVITSDPEQTVFPAAVDHVSFGMVRSGAVELRFERAPDRVGARPRYGGLEHTLGWSSPPGQSLTATLNVAGHSPFDR